MSDRSRGQPHSINKTRLEVFIALMSAALFFVFVGADLRAYHRQDPRLRAKASGSGSMSLLDWSGLRYENTETIVNGTCMVIADGLCGTEHEGPRRFRHGLGPATSLTVRSARPRARLRLEFYNGVPGQELQITFNGTPLETLSDIPQTTLTRVYDLEFRPQAANQFVMTFARYNHGGVEIAPGDGRPIAVTFFGLDLDFFEGK